MPGDGIKAENMSRSIPNFSSPAFTTQRRAFARLAWSKIRKTNFVEPIFVISLANQVRPQIIFCTRTPKPTIQLQA